MKQFWNSHLLKITLPVAVVFLATTQTTYAQTALDYSFKTDQEKSKIIESTFQEAFKRLASIHDFKWCKKVRGNFDKTSPHIQSTPRTFKRRYW